MHIYIYRTVERLISQGVNAMDPAGEHILHIAANCPNSKIVELLIACWPNYINITNEDGITPLHVASMYGRLLTIKILIENGADPFVADNEGMTPLDYSSKENHKSCIEYYNKVGITQEDETVEEDSMAIAYASMEVTILEDESTLCYSLSDVTLVEEDDDLQQLTNSMIRKELMKIGEKPGPVNDLTRGAYLRYLHKVKNGLLPTQKTQEINSKLYTDSSYILYTAIFY